MREKTKAVRRRMREKTKAVRRHRIREVISGIEFAIVLVGMSGMDSEDLTVPIVMVAQAMIWFILFCPECWYDTEEGGR